MALYVVYYNIARSSWRLPNFWVSGTFCVCVIIKDERIHTIIIKS